MIELEGVNPNMIANNLEPFEPTHPGELLKDAFNAEPGETSVMLDGIVSRKKQFLPTIIEAMEAQNV